ncbi:ParB N-terminal domain-containing protein [Maricaulis sp.]|uniref:ParB N-terminal domain-containing protein n=1 Tax=Maricaulis sp. TaxID=1486257 RepID=UPI002B278CC6|nr:ParB N-terminal domain-containing protein [Maricaulis sp.]
MNATDLPLDQIILDPNNYRYHDVGEYRSVPDDARHLDKHQDRALKTLRQIGLEEIRESILKNGFIPVERIVVEPYGEEPNRYIVIEGNRRIASLKLIQRDLEEGLIEDNDGRLAALFQAVPCIVVEQGNEEFFRHVLMGIRHVGGIKEWGGYQSAKLVQELRDEFGLDGQDVAGRIGLSVQECNRRYRAIKALKQMEQNEDFGGFAKPDMYPIFHEAVSLPRVREWLGWNAETFQFDEEAEVENFYQLITPTEQEDGGRPREPKIRTYSDVRELRNILQNGEATRVLLDESASFFDSVTLARSQEQSKRWRRDVGAALNALEAIPFAVVKDFTQDDKDVLNKLAKLATGLASE